MQNIKSLAVRADFAGRLGRLTDPMIDSFDIFEGLDRETSLSTIAFLYGNSNPKRLNSLGLETCLLALYAAGACVTLTRQELFDLSGELRRFSELYNLPEMQDNPNGRILHYVFNQAMARAGRESIPLGSRVDVPVGFKLLRLQKDAACTVQSDDDEKRSLRTIAFANLHPDPMENTLQSLGVAMLAIWASGACVALSESQFEELRFNAGLVAFAPLGKGERDCRNRQARFVLDKADERARQEGLIVQN